MFEDPNSLAVRLTWLKKNNWQYHQLKKAIGYIVVAIMFFCFLPMTRAEKQNPNKTGKSAEKQIIDSSDDLRKSASAKNMVLQSKESKMEQKYLKNVMPLRSGIVDHETQGRECYLFGALESVLRDNWHNFPMTHWVKPEEGYIWSPAGNIDGTEWTNEMRLRGADVRDKVKDWEIEAYRLMEDLL